MTITGRMSVIVSLILIEFGFYMSVGNSWQHNQFFCSYYYTLFCSYTPGLCWTAEEFDSKSFKVASHKYQYEHCL